MISPVAKSGHHRHRPTTKTSELKYCPHGILEDQSSGIQIVLNPQFFLLVHM